MFLVDWIANDGTLKRQGHDNEQAADDHATQLMKAGVVRVTYFEMNEPKEGR